MGKREIVPAHLPQFCLACSGAGEGPLYGLDEARCLLGRADRIRMLVESHVTGFEKFFKQIAVTEGVETTGAADEIYCPRFEQAPELPGSIDGFS